MLLSLLIVGCAPGGVTPTSGALTPKASTNQSPADASGVAPTAIPISPPTPAPRAGTPAALPPGIGGEFVFAPGDGSIWLQNGPAARPHAIVTPSPSNFAEAPTFSPDGARIAYVQAGYDAQGKPQDSIHTLGTDGKNDQAVATPVEATTEFNWPAYSPDGQWIYYSASIKAAQSKLNEEIQRVPSGGGKPEKVIDQGRSAVLSPDGKRIAFIRFNSANFRDALWIADADGRNLKSLLAEDVFMTIAAPHFSPDGQWILFAASGPPGGPLHGLLAPPPACEPRLLCALAAPAYADGLPWDLWMISADGIRFRQLTNIGTDSPWPAWSRDGQYIAFFQITGTYLLDLRQGVIVQLNHNGGHGIFDWWSGP